MKIIASGRDPTISAGDLSEAVHQLPASFSVGILRVLRVGDLKTAHTSGRAGPKRQLEVFHVVIDSRVGEHGNAACGTHQRHGVVQAEVLGSADVGPATRTHDGVELLARDLGIGRLHRSHDVWLAHVPQRAPAHGLPVDWIPGLREQPDGLALLRLPFFARQAEAETHGGVVQVEGIAEQVCLDQAAVGLVLDRQLHAGKDAHAPTLQIAEGVNPGQGVVVGKRDCSEPGPGVRPDDIRRLELAVAEDRMQVQVGVTVGKVSHVGTLWRRGPIQARAVPAGPKRAP